MEKEVNFKSIAPVLSSDKIIDKAFKKASEAARSLVIRGPPLSKAKGREKHRVSVAVQVIDSLLFRVMKGFPDILDLPPFYSELVDILVGVDKLKKTLARVNWARKKIKSLARREVRKINAVKDPGEAAKIRKGIYGRAASILSDISGDLEFLERARLELKRMPTIRDMTTIVVAGYPNVGKSTFVKNVSTAKPKIDVYPFTTKEIHVGFASLNGLNIQVIDTPGILDRPVSKRNRIEKKAISALRHLADAIIFMIDPSETCGFSIKNQLSLLREVRDTFPEKPIVVVLNKADLAEEKIVNELKGNLNCLVTTSTSAKEAMDTFKECLRRFGLLSS